MSTIRAIYAAEPEFPATDQHPDAVRYEIGGRWVDAIGGPPTQEEIDAFGKPTRWLVPKLLIVDRLIAADLDDEAFAALGAPGNERLKRRWDAAVEVWSDDPDALALLAAIAADPAAILAPA